MLVRKIIRQLGMGFQYTGAYFANVEENARFFGSSLPNRPKKLAFVIASAFYTVLIVNAPNGQLLRLTFFLKHKKVLKSLFILKIIFL